MNQKRSFEAVEELMRRFSPAAPSAGAAERLLARAKRVRLGRRRVAYAAAALAAAACIAAAFLWRGAPSAPSQPPARQPAVATAPVSERELALISLDLLRDELAQIDEMKELIPAGKDEERRAIMTKIDSFFQRLDQIEKSLSMNSDQSFNPRKSRKEVHV